MDRVVRDALNSAEVREIWNRHCNLTVVLTLANSALAITSKTCNKTTVRCCGVGICYSTEVLTVLKTCITNGYNTCNSDRCICSSCHIKSNRCLIYNIRDCTCSLSCECSKQTSLC